MKKIVTLVFAIIISQNCSSPNTSNTTKETTSIENAILNFALKEEVSNENLIKSHLLLSNLVLTETQIVALKDKLALRKDDDIKHLVANYLLWTQTQEDIFKNEFIKSYPTANNLLLLNAAILNSDYKVAASPLQKTLASFATDNKDALVKLLKSIKYSDGANAEELYNQLRAIYMLNKSRVLEISNKLGINIDEIIN